MTSELTLMDGNQIKTAKRTLYELLLQKPCKADSEMILITELSKDPEIRFRVNKDSVRGDL